MRINARLESEHRRKLAYLKASTGKSTTDIVRTSLELYFEHVAGPASNRALLEDFVGSAHADADLSTRYKAQLTTSLERKTGSARTLGKRK